jgi:hypothetical protein
MEFPRNKNQIDTTAQIIEVDSTSNINDKMINN